MNAACWVPIIYFFFPETKGLELEDVDRLFAKEGSATARRMSRPLTEDLHKSLGAGHVENVLGKTEGHYEPREVEEIA